MDIIVTDKDFIALSSTQMQWNDIEWENQLNRFDFEQKPDFEFVFWFQDYAHMVLARHFLITNKYDFQYSWDEGAEEYCIVTNFVGSWDKVDA